MSQANRYFSSDTLAFLRKLARHNQRDWFETHKSEYEELVRAPALQFITDVADDLAVISPHFLAQAKKVGGSLMRVQRDVRFSKDKQPYKTNIGIQFRHEQGKDVHAPGFYVHIAPNDCFVGVGLWRPDAPALGKIRDAIRDTPDKWRIAQSDKTYHKYYTVSGESLTRPPRGYDVNHPFIDDIKRKDFIAVSAMGDDAVISPQFKKQVLARFRAADAYMQFLCNALTLRY